MYKMECVSRRQSYNLVTLDFDINMLKYDKNAAEHSSAIRFRSPPEATKGRGANKLGRGECCELPVILKARRVT